MAQRSPYAILKAHSKTNKTAKYLLKYAAKDLSDLDDDKKEAVLGEASLVLAYGEMPVGALYEETDEPGDFILEVNGRDGSETALEDAVEELASSIKAKVKLVYYPFYHTESPSPYASKGEAQAAGNKMLPKEKSSYIDAKVKVTVSSDKDEDGTAFYYPVVTVDLKWNAKAKDWLK